VRIRDVDDYLGQFLIFFATLDPVGTLALFVGLTAASPDEERRRIALRAVLYSAAILVTAILVGQVLLGSLGIRLAAFQLAGGLIFFLFGVQMVFGSGPLSGEAGIDADHDVAVFPLAVPSIASPGAILACVVLTDNREYSISEQAISTLMLLAVLGLTLGLLLLANRVYALIGRNGATLLVRVLGLVLASLAVEMVLGAGSELIADLPIAPT